MLRAARRIADANDPLGREARARLPGASGLSPQGVELALAEHMETTATEAELDAFVAGAAPASRAWVVLSANVCTAAVRALAWALAASSVVRVKPSRRDPVVAELLVRALADEADIALVRDLDVAPGDAVHAYGSDASLDAIAAALPPGAAFAGHGTGIGVAIVTAGEVDRQASQLADDLLAFDGMGCLSPRIALVAADAHGTHTFAAALDAALTRRGEHVPRGPLEPAAAAELTRYRMLAEAMGTWLERPHHAIAVDPEPEVLALPPAQRCILVALSDEPASLLGDLARHVTCIGHGHEPPPRALLERCPNARVVPLGRMQKPPLDGPVDRRTRTS